MKSTATILVALAVILQAQYSISKDVINKDLTDTLPKISISKDVINTTNDVYNVNLTDTLPKMEARIKCPKDCPYENKPVCGSNGHVYSSKCDLDKEACMLSRRLERRRRIPKETGKKILYMTKYKIDEEECPNANVNADSTDPEIYCPERIELRNFPEFSGQQFSLDFNGEYKKTTWKVPSINPSSDPLGFFFYKAKFLEWNSFHGVFVYEGMNPVKKYPRLKYCLLYIKKTNKLWLDVCFTFNNGWLKGKFEGDILDCYESDTCGYFFGEVDKTCPTDVQNWKIARNMTRWSESGQSQESSINSVALEKLPDIAPVRTCNSNEDCGYNEKCHQVPSNGRNADGFCLPKIKGCKDEFGCPNVRNEDGYGWSIEHGNMDSKCEQIHGGRNSYCNWS